MRKSSQHSDRSLKLTKSVRYALRMMLNIAKHRASGKPVNLNQISRETTMPRRFLEQLVIPLKTAALLRGTTGRGGGYSLTRAPEEIRIGEIIKVMSGPINIVECVGDPEACMLSGVCRCRPLYGLINQRITTLLNEYSLADMLKESWTEDMSPSSTP